MVAVNENTRASVVHLVPIDSVKAAPWNPASRTSQRRISKLVASIEDVGLLYPLLIDTHGNIVDGHRRHAALKQLEWERVPAITVSSEFEHTYGSVNLNQDKMTGNDLIGIYLVNKKALLGKQKRKVERVEQECGRDTLDLLYKSGLSVGLFDLAMRVVRYVETKVEPKVVVKWLIRHSMGHLIRHALDDGISKTAIVNAIGNDKPLKIKMTAG